jgi:hypothetical protein
MGTVVTSKKCLDVKIALASIVVHLNFSNAPHESYVVLGIIETVAIIEVNRMTQRVFGTFCPLKNLLRSVNSQETIHFAFLL